MTFFKYVSGILFALSISLSVIAEEQPKKQLMNRLEQLQSFTASFAQQVVDSNGNIVHQASGSIALAKPNNLLWHTTAPDEIILIADGQSIYQIDYFVEQVSIINQSDAVNSNPMMLLTSTNENDWQQFNVSIIENGFEIKAKQQGAIASLTLEFENDVLARIKSIDSQEQESQLVFSEQIENKPLSDDLFEPNLPSGFIIDDQRP